MDKATKSYRVTFVNPNGHRWTMDDDYTGADWPSKVGTFGRMGTYVEAAKLLSQ